MHSSFVISQAALLRRTIIAFVTGKGDPGVLGHLVNLETVGLCGLIVAFVAWVAAPLVYGQLVFTQVALARCTVGTTTTLPPTISLQKKGKDLTSTKFFSSKTLFNTIQNAQ
jgi:hypothetical protein